MASVKILKRRLASGEDSFSLRINVHGKRGYEALNIRARPSDKVSYRAALAFAEDARMKRLLDLASSTHGLHAATYTHKQTMLFGFVKELAEKRHGKNKETWMHLLKHLSAFAPKDISLEAITPEWMESFQRALLSKMKPNTAKTYDDTLRTALAAAVRAEYLSRNPALQVKRIKAQESARQFLTLNEIKQIAAIEENGKSGGAARNKKSLSVEAAETRAAFLFSCFCGLRFSDVASLTWDKVERDQSTVAIMFRQQKTQAVERMPLSESAAALLLKRMPNKASREKIFHISRKQSVNAHLKHIARLAGIEKNLHFHIARHTFATLALTYNVPIEIVSKLLGHRDLKTTQVYAKIIDAKKTEAVMKLPILFFVVPERRG